MSWERGGEPQIDIFLGEGRERVQMEWYLYLNNFFFQKKKNTQNQPKMEKNLSPARTFADSLLEVSGVGGAGGHVLLTTSCGQSVLTGAVLSVACVIVLCIDHSFTFGRGNGAQGWEEGGGQRKRGARRVGAAPGGGLQAAGDSPSAKTSTFEVRPKHHQNSRRPPEREKGAGEGTNSAKLWAVRRSAVRRRAVWWRAVLGGGGQGHGGGRGGLLAKIGLARPKSAQIGQVEGWPESAWSWPKWVVAVFFFVVRVVFLWCLNRGVSSRED